MTARLLNDWTLDRAPGGGKVVFANPGTASSAAFVGGLVGLGVPSTLASVPPTYAALPPAGSVIPAAGPDRASFFLAFKEAVGFDGQTLLTGWNGAGVSGAKTGFALSAWINFGVQGIPGFNPNPLQGLLFDNESGANTANSVLYPSGGLSGSSTPSVPGVGTSVDGNGAVSGAFVVGTVNSGDGGTVAFDYPGNGTTNAGWVHFMASWKFTPVKAGAAFGFIERSQIVVNDTVLVNLTTTFHTDQTGYIDFSNSSDATLQSVGGDRNNPPTAGWYGAVTEYAVYQSFIDWSVQANRYKFHVTDGNGAFQTWAPCDIGSKGTKPGFGTPLLYLSGGSSLFPKNRAAGGAALTVVTGTSGLIDIDDPPA